MKITAFLPRLAEADGSPSYGSGQLACLPEKLCLNPISIAGQDELLDPLSAMDARPLFEVLGRHELIFHGADYACGCCAIAAVFVRRYFRHDAGQRLLGTASLG